MKCPICNIDLLMGERLTVSIDYCPQCRGIWLEKGKLDQIINNCGSNSQTQECGNTSKMRSDYTEHGNDHHHSDDYDHDSHHKKKKKSFFDDLF